MYKIKYSYNTGDSFHTTKDIQEILEYEWGTLSEAQEALNCIKEHYIYYKANREHTYDKKRQEINNKIINDAEIKPWFVKEHEGCLKLIADNDNEYQFHATWCGYFESLNWAEIIVPMPNQMRIEF